MTYIQNVHELVKKVPRGKVTTYGVVARELKIENLKLKIDARMVGWALHQNKDPKVPCHRVVNREGRLALNFAFDGPMEQKRRLEAEGVTFRDEMHINLKKYFWGSTIAS